MKSFFNKLIKLRDNYWGWGPNRDGQNMLGKLWMKIRDELNQKEPVTITMIKAPLPVGMEDTPEMREKISQALTPNMWASKIANDPKEKIVKDKESLWSAISPPNDYYRCDHTYLDTPLGRALIEWKSWKAYPSYGLLIGDHFIDSFDSIEDAKLHVREYITDKKKELERFLNDWSL